MLLVRSRFKVDSLFRWLNKAVEQPKYVYHGHVHSEMGVRIFS